MTLLLILAVFCCAFIFLLIRCIRASIIVQALALFLFAGIGYGLIPHLMLYPLQNQYRSLPEPQWGKHNTIILLTGGATVAVIAEVAAWFRIQTAARLFQACKDSHNGCTLLVSGGDVGDQGISVAENYQKALLQSGITQDEITLETRSMNTWQNAKFSCELLKKNPHEKVFLVTSGYHLKRALLDFSHFGVDAVPVPANFLDIETSLFPTTENIESNDSALHEYLGLLQFYLYHYWKSEPCSQGVKSIPD